MLRSTIPSCSMACRGAALASVKSPAHHTFLASVKRKKREKISPFGFNLMRGAALASVKSPAHHTFLASVKRKRTEKATTFGIKFMRSTVLYRAAQA